MLEGLRAFPVRRRVIVSTNLRCWLCSQDGAHVAQIIPLSDLMLVSLENPICIHSTTDAPQFMEFWSTNLLHVANVQSSDNLIDLCTRCHDAFKLRIPAWAFLPTPLAPFLAAELAFHAARTEAAAARTLLLRPIPVATPAPLLYERYQIRRGHVVPQVFVKNPTQHWAGNPIAAILGSAGLLMGVQRLHVQTDGGIPEEVAKTL